VFGSLLPGLGAGLCGPGRGGVSVGRRHRGGGFLAQLVGLFLDALPFLGQRAALLVEHGLDTFGGIRLGGIHASLRVDANVLGFFPGGRLGGDGGLGKATCFRYLGFGFGPDAFGLGEGFLCRLVGLGAFLDGMLTGPAAIAGFAFGVRLGGVGFRDPCSAAR